MRHHTTGSRGHSRRVLRRLIAPSISRSELSLLDWKIEQSIGSRLKKQS
jgi:hypothetical protein